MQYRLIEEVTEIGGSVEDLQKRLGQSEASLKVLFPPYYICGSEIRGSSGVSGVLNSFSFCVE